MANAPRRFRNTLTLSLLLLSGCGVSSSSRLKATIDPLATDFQLGRGINILNGNALGDCLQPLNPAPAFDVDGKESSFSISKISSSQDLIKQMGLTPKAKYFGTEGNQGKTSFSEQFAISEQSLFLAFTVRVTNPLYTASNASLKPEAITLYQNQGAEAFREACGDEYVRSFTSGGEFITVLSIHAKNESHKKQLEDSLKGSFGTYSENESFAKNLETILNQNQTDLFVYQSGGTFEHLNLTAEALLNKALSYPSSITKLNSRPIIAYTAPYRTILNFPGGTSSFDISASEKILNQLAEDDLTLSDLIKGILYVFDHEHEYKTLSSTTRQTLNDALVSVEDSVMRIRSQAGLCIDDYRACRKPDYTIPRVTLPARREDGPVTRPDVGPSPSEANACILWIASDGVPHHKSKSDEGERRTKYVLPIGQNYKYKSGLVGKEYTCRKVKDGIQTLDLRLTTSLGYWEDRVVKEAIDYQ